ncbi:MAG TPA: hypothetical protein VIL99_09315 [Ignavibacteria bacterium]
MCGICGGYIINKYSDDKMIVEKSDDYYVRGALNTVRKKCWDEIKGFKEVWFWDGLDNIEARFHGWNTKSIDVKVIHHRPTSSTYNLIEHDYICGYASYKLGNYFFLSLLRAAVRIKQKPYFIASIAFLSGFIISYLKREPLIISHDSAVFIRKFNYSRLFKIFSTKE